MSEGGYTREQIRDIKRKVLRITIRRLTMQVHAQYAPDFFVEQTMAQADKFIEKYRHQPEVDIWRNARLDYYTIHLLNKLIIEHCYEYEISRYNSEAVENLKEAEDMLGDQLSDEELILMFDYTPEELARLRILAKYPDEIDADQAYTEFAQKYHLE